MNSPAQRAKDKRLYLRERGKANIMWAPAMNRWRDQTGIAHVVYDGGALCGANPFSSGGSFHSAAAAGAQECRRCRRIIDEVFPCKSST